MAAGRLRTREKRKVTIRRRISRRTALKGLGTLVALHPGWKRRGSRRGPAKAGAPPTRMAFFYVPNGVNMVDWTPSWLSGARLPPSPASSNLWPRSSKTYLCLAAPRCHRTPTGHGSGNHFAGVSRVSDRPAARPAVPGVHLGISAADQIARHAAGRYTRLPSLRIGCEPATPVEPLRRRPIAAALHLHHLLEVGNLAPAPRRPPALISAPTASSHSETGRDAEKSRRPRPPRTPGHSGTTCGRTPPSCRSTLMQRRPAPDRRISHLRCARSKLASSFRPGASFWPSSAARNVPSSRPPLTRASARPVRPSPIAWPSRADVTRVSTFLFANEFAAGNRQYPCIGIPEGHHDLSHTRQQPGQASAKIPGRSTAFAIMPVRLPARDKLKAVRAKATARCWTTA